MKYAPGDIVIISKCFCGATFRPGEKVKILDNCSYFYHADSLDNPTKDTTCYWAVNDREISHKYNLLKLNINTKIL